jgi:hypothetical protein
MPAEQPDDSIRPDYGAAIDFLRKWSPHGPLVLTAIIPDPPKKGPKTFTETFSATEDGRLRAWLEEQGSLRRGIYFTVNPVARAVKTKPRREHISALAWLHVDVDPADPPKGTSPETHYAAERERILAALRDPPEGIPKPTCIVFSGGGYQAFWRLELPKVLDHSEVMFEDAKLWNLALEGALGGDHCHNVDRIMRLPGTVNWPKQKKRENGRVPTLAELVEWNDERVYGLGEFPKAEADAPASAGGGARATVAIGDKVPRLASVDDLPPKVNDKAKIVIVQGLDPDEPNKFGSSRSEWLFFACCELVRAEVKDDLIYGIITDPTWPISESVLDKGSGVHAYAVRQIERAHEFADDFTRSKKGAVLGTLWNIRMALTKLGVTLEFDEFADRSLISGLADFGPYLDDPAVTRLWLAIEETFNLGVGKDRFWSVVQDVARRNRRHPVREYLDALRWDGTARIDRWLTDYLGAAESDYTRAVGALFLVAAVRRVRSPGCKFDEMLVLEGPQGGDKSSALATLAGKQDWFTDDLPLNAVAQKFIEATIGKWIIEAGELKGMRKSDVESLKSCLSRQVDRARMAYGRLPLERARQFVIFGTTNSKQYLRDGTGNRRFWPVEVGAVSLAELRHDRDMLWAEAAVREASGTSIRLDPALYAAAGIEQEARRVEDPFVQRLGDMLGSVEGKLRAEDAWAIVGLPGGNRTQDHNQRLGDAMRELGWAHKRLRFGHGPEWAYTRGDASIKLELRLTEYGVVLGVHVAGSAASEQDQADAVFDNGYHAEPPEGWLNAYRRERA